MTESTHHSNNRAVLLLIGGIPVVMILLATWLWYFVARGDLDLVGILGTANRGTLVQPPRSLEAVPLADGDGATLRYADLAPHWTLLVASAGPACNADCEAGLYLTRQIHLAMGKEFNRIQRAYVSDQAVPATTLAVDVLSDGRPAPERFGDYLENEHRGLESLVVPAAVYAELFPEQAADSTTWYLVDPAGWIMMSYNSEISYKDVIADLKFLLKNSGG